MKSLQEIQELSILNCPEINKIRNEIEKAARLGLFSVTFFIEQEYMQIIRIGNIFSTEGYELRYLKGSAGPNAIEISW